MSTDLRTQLADYGRYQRSERRPVELSDIRAAGATGIAHQPARSPDHTTRPQPDPGESNMVDVQTRESHPVEADGGTPRKWLPYTILAAAAVIIVIVAVALFDDTEGSAPVDVVDAPENVDPAPSDQDTPPEVSDIGPSEVVEAYIEAYNSGDIDAVMALFSEESVITGQPFDAEAAGLEAIRTLHRTDMRAAAATDAYEISNVEVSGDTITWDHVWTNNAGQRYCAVGHNAVVEDGKILSWTWPEPVLCP